MTITYPGKPRATLVGSKPGTRRPRAAPIPFSPSACGVIAMTSPMWTPMFAGCAKGIGMLIDTDVLIWFLRGQLDGVRPADLGFVAVWCI